MRSKSPQASPKRNHERHLSKSTALAAAALDEVLSRNKKDLWKVEDTHLSNEEPAQETEPVEAELEWQEVMRNKVRFRQQVSKTSLGDYKHTIESQE